MADLNGLENLSGPVAAPAPLGQAPPTSFNPGIVNAGFAPVAQALTQGGGTVSPAIGSGIGQAITGGYGTNTTPTGGSGMGAVSGGVAPGLAGLTGVGPGGNVAGNLTAQASEPMFIPETELEGQDLQNEEFSEAYETGGKRGLRQARRADRKADRQERKAKGLKGKAKRQERRSQRRSRKDSKWHAKSGA